MVRLRGTRGSGAGRDVRRRRSVAAQLGAELLRGTLGAVEERRPSLAATDTAAPSRSPGSEHGAAVPADCEYDETAAEAAAEVALLRFAERVFAARVARAREQYGADVRLGAGAAPPHLGEVCFERPPPDGFALHHSPAHTNHRF